MKRSEKQNDQNNTTEGSQGDEEKTILMFLVIISETNTSKGEKEKNKNKTRQNSSAGKKPRLPTMAKYYFHLNEKQSQYGSLRFELCLVLLCIGCAGIRMYAVKKYLHK